MTTRFNVPSDPRILKTGYTSNSQADVTIPSCGLEDVDRAVFNLFDREMNLSVLKSDGALHKVPVVFASGEKWVILKKKKALRDRSGSIILPILTIGRTDVSQDSSDITTRGMNQFTGEMIIRRSLSSADRSYQNIINKAFITNNNVDVSTRRATGSSMHDGTVVDGALLAPDLHDNIIETIVIPAPQFFTSKYEVTVWTQYHTQMNAILETMMSAQLAQGQAYRVETDKGYWFVAKIDSTFSPDNNFDEMVESERIIKHKFSLAVKAYLLASDAPGAPVAVRRYVSSPVIDFSFAASNDELTSSDGDFEEPLLGASDPTAPLATSGILQRVTGHGPIEDRAEAHESDPLKKLVSRGSGLSKWQRVSVVSSGGKRSYRYIRTGIRGESVIR